MVRRAPMLPGQGGVVGWRQAEAACWDTPCQAPTAGILVRLEAKAAPAPAGLRCTGVLRTSDLALARCSGARARVAHLLTAPGVCTIANPRVVCRSNSWDQGQAEFNRRLTLAGACAS